MNAKKKKIYGGVFGLAALGLLLDQVVLQSSPEEAEATQQSIDVNSVVGETPRALMISVEAAPFPQTQSDNDSKDLLRDPFEMTDKIRHDMLGISVGGKQGSAGKAVASGIEEFVQKHRLNGVMTGGSSLIAVVDGALLKIGDTLDGCELKTVRSTAVEFSCREGVAILSVPGLEGR